MANSYSDVTGVYNESQIMTPEFLGGMNTPITNIERGGSQGWSPRLGLLDGTAEWISEKPFVQEDVMAFILEYPKGFDILPGGELLKRILKSYWEDRVSKIDGLKATLTIEYAEHSIGRSGQKYQVAVKSTREQSEISTTAVEPAGRPFERMTEVWLKYLVRDDVTQSPLITTVIPSSRTVKEIYFDYLNSCTILFIEPDTSRRYVERAYLTFNMKPKQTPEISSKKDIDGSAEIKENTIPWTGITSISNGVYELAQNMLDNIAVLGTDPFYNTIAVSQDVKEAVDAKLKEIKGFDETYNTNG